jgi:hypothetical protein
MSNGLKNEPESLALFIEQGNVPQDRLVPGKTSPENSGEIRGWRHGEIFFEESMRTCKYLIVPKSVTEPAQVLSMMLGHWKMTKPSMVCTAQSSNYDYLSAYKQEVWVGGEVGTASEKKDSLVGLMKKARDADSSQNVVLWGEDEAEIYSNYQAKVNELMLGVCSACAECGGWLKGSGERCGGYSSGAIFERGVKLHQATNPTMNDKITFVGFPEFHRDSIEPIYDSGIVEKLQFPSLVFPFKEPVDLYAKGKPLNEEVDSQVVYPRVDWAQPVKIDKSDKPQRSDVEMLSMLGRLAFNPFMTHIVFCEQENMGTQIDNLLEAIVPHVNVIVAGKTLDAATQGSFMQARRGAQVIVMQNTGIYVNVLAKAVLEKKKGEALAAVMLEASAEVISVVTPDGMSVKLPEGIDHSRFLIFDALRDSADVVIEKLTKALTTVGGDEMKELGFAQSEQDRLSKAWSTYISLKHNEARFSSYRFWLKVLMSFVSLSTTAAAVMSASGDLKGVEDGVDGIVVHGSIPLTTFQRTVLAASCAALPLLTTFLQSWSSTFSPDAKYGALVVASTRVLGEIYRYRTRSGAYEPKAKNARLQTIMSSMPSQEAVSSGLTPVQQQKPSQQQPSDNKKLTKPGMERSLFSDQLAEIYRSTVTSVMSLDTLAEPPSSFKAAVVQDLYQAVEKDDPGVTYQASHPLLDIERGKRGGYSALDAILNENVSDDGIGLLTAEDYLEVRIEPTVKTMKRSASRLNRCWFAAQVLTFFGVMCAGFLGLLGLRIWIPVVVAVAAAIENIAEFLHLKQRLSSTTGALMELENLLTWWRGLSMVERRMSHNKNHLVDVAEEAIENPCAIYARSGPKRRMRNEGEDEDDEKKDGKKTMSKGNKTE